MNVGDDAFYYHGHHGLQSVVKCRVKSIEGEYAKVVALPTAARGFGVKTVAVTRLKPLVNLPVRKDS